MPRGDMFGDVVDPSIKLGSQKWYTVPLSILLHVLIIGGVVIIPLMVGLDVVCLGDLRPTKQRRTRNLVHRVDFTLRAPEYSTH